jgi:Beta protein
MIFGPRHYVPILKIKRGEKLALQQLTPTIRASITPLLEVVERNAAKKPTVAKHLETAFNRLDNAVVGVSRYLLDCREIAPDGPSAAAEVFTRAARLRTPFTPVTGLSRAVDEKAALVHRANGLAIRLTRDEFEAGRIPSELPAFLRTHGLAPTEVDIIVDLGAVDDMIAAGVEGLTEAFLADVPDKRLWRTLTVSGCAFPLSMGGIDRNSYDLVERAEWQAWRDGLHANRARLERLPTFSDCAIQHPSGVEGFDHRFMAVAASIRCTLPEQWLLIKGVSTKLTLPSDQFPDLANQLVYGHLSSYFPGAGHCGGCADMRAAADGAPDLGSAEQWRRLGTIHHLTRTAEQIAALAWP